MKVANIIGARPQFVKYFPVSEAVRRMCGSGRNVEDILIHTGQHYDYSMSKIFFDELGIKAPDYHLGVGSGLHGAQTALILEQTEKVFLDKRPDAVIVYGDTNSTLGGALAAAKLHIPVVHVESGLRSYNKNMPEEINRVITDHVATILFCPTETAVTNLEKEGFTGIVNSGKFIEDVCPDLPRDVDKSSPVVVNVGDVMYDALLGCMKRAEQKPAVFGKYRVDLKEYCFLTIHRAENTDNPEKLRGIMDFVCDVSAGRKVLFPMHPRTRKIYDGMGKKFPDNIGVIEPVGYFDLLMLVKNSALVMTDSGGLQKEAYWLQTPCITLRDETEWVETVQNGWNVLYKNYDGSHQISQPEASLYGDGKTAEKIIAIIMKNLDKEKE